MQSNAFSREVVPSALGRNNSRFTVGDELLHGTVDGDPPSVDGLDQCLLGRVWDDKGGVPSCASVQHMEDDGLAHEEKITFDLLVEGVGEIHTASSAWAKLGPLSAY